MTREIPLSRGKVALVDDADFEWLSGWKWCWTPSRAGEGRGYACRTVRVDGRVRSVWMHREILGGDAEGDHANGDSLDNRRLNLREATHQQNARNRTYKRARPGYKGASAQGPHWRACIVHDGRQLQIGTYEREIEAAIAYDRAAVALFGEFARLNFDPGRDWLLPYAVEPRSRSRIDPIISNSEGWAIAQLVA